MLPCNFLIGPENKIGINETIGEIFRFRFCPLFTHDMNHSWGFILMTSVRFGKPVLLRHPRCLIFNFYHQVDCSNLRSVMGVANTIIAILATSHHQRVICEEKPLRKFFNAALDAIKYQYGAFLSTKN